MDQAYEGLEREAPDRIKPFIRWLHGPRSRKFRLPIGILLIACGLVGFLPIVGYEFIPVGLLVISQDIPFMRRPMGKFVSWLLDKWKAIKKWWKRKHSHQH